MAKKIKCPDAKWFTRLAKGNVTEEQEETLSLHLEQCKDCQQAVEKLNDLSKYTSDTAHRPAPTIGIGTGSQKLKQRLAEIKSQSPTKSLSASGYLDVMPWLESSESALAKIDEFELLEFIGRGGMGVVFKCLDTKLQREVALKLMSPQLLIDEAASERFLREARSAAKINHPNVVTVHGVNEIQGLPYLVMEYIEGYSLEEKLAAQQPLRFNEIIRTTQQTVAGLAAAHAKGVLHRDIKPANIMLDQRTGQAKITDFGLACSIEGSKLTRTGFLVGTPEFLSPEQAAGSKIDERSDLFSLGSVIYAMCCGKSPFCSSSMVTTLDKVRSMNPEPIQEINSNTPIWFVQIVERLLQKDPSSRLNSASETLAAIESHLTDSEIAIPRIDLSSNKKIRANQKIRETSYLRSLALVSAASLLLIGTVFWWFYTGKQQLGSPETGQIEDNSASNVSPEHPGLQPIRFDKDGRALVANQDQLLQAIALEREDVDIFIEPRSIIELSQIVEVRNKTVLLISDNEEPATFLIEQCKDPAFEIHDSEVTFQNVTLKSDLNLDWEKEEDEDDLAPVILCVDGSLSILQSHLRCLDPRPTIELENSNCIVKGSLLANIENVFTLVPLRKDQTLSFTNSLVVAPFAIFTNAIESIRLNLESSMVVSEFALSLDHESLEENQLRIDSRNSLLISTEAMMTIDIDSSSELYERLEKVDFSASKCGIPENLVQSHTENSEVEIALVEHLSGIDTNNIVLEDLSEFEFEELAESVLEGDFDFLEPHEELVKIELDLDAFRKIQLDFQK